MDWVKVSVNITDDPKMLDLPDDAFRLYIETLAWVGKHETDGRIVGRKPPELVDELVEAGLWDRTEEGFLSVHGWDRWQRTHAEMEAQRDRGRNASRYRWSDARSQVEVETRSDTSVDANSIRTSNAEGEVEVEVEETTTRVENLDEAYALVDQLREHVKARGLPVHGQRRAWAVEADRLMRIDGVAFEDAKEMVDWCQVGQAGEYQFDVQSMRSFRGKYGRMKEFRRKQQPGRDRLPEMKLEDD